MSIKKFSMMLLSAMSMAALLSGCGASSKEGTTNLGGVARVPDEATCRVCHASTIDPVSQTAIVADFITSAHNTDALGCQGCHGGGAQHNGVGPIPFPNPLTSNRCIECHTNTDIAPLFVLAKAGFVSNGCANCHTASRVGSVHGAQVTSTDDCVLCHSVAAPQHGSGLVNDNNGVRAITSEFAKWSHHVTGVTLNAAHCSACHLEGTVVDGKIVVDKTKHMVDAKIHLRDTTANTDADFAWDPAAPSFSGMDTFCLSCHDANGAVSPMSARIQNIINITPGLAAPGKTASASNPFGDTISNQYDKLERPAVVDAKSQFAPGNNSHHAVLGKKYSGRTRTGSVRAVAAGFASNSSAALPGVRSTIYDAGKFEATYTTLADAAGESGTRNGGTDLGDDSTLHCGDCHTVGQFSNTQVGFGGRYNKVAIGAHGSNNEYLLRNNLGTDEKHTGAKFAGSGNFGSDLGFGNMPYLVCFNCHAFKTYGSSFGTSGGGHAGEYDQDGRCNGAGQTINSVFGNLVGEDRLKTFNTDETKYGQQEGTNTFGNLFGIECNNCHNSGVGGNMFGGIHGSKVQTYTDGAGNISKHMRFMPGLGNSMYAPGTLGGITGGSLATFNAYSGNRNGTGTGNTTGQTFSLLPVREVRIAGVDNANGSYQYVTGGVSSDLNWEQRVQQPIAGQTILSAKAMGCYTLGPNGVNKIDFTGTAGNGVNKVSNVPADFVDQRKSATDGQMAGYETPFLDENGVKKGAIMFDNWGGCDDHNGAQGGGTGPTRKVLRKVTY